MDHVLMATSGIGATDGPIGQGAALGGVDPAARLALTVVLPASCFAYRKRTFKGTTP